MRRLAHLSDLHFGPASAERPEYLKRVLVALEDVGEVDAVLITGNVFSTSSPGRGVVDAFVDFHAAIEKRLGARRPTIILPGNRDRRGDGVFAPYSEQLFDDLRARLAGRPHVQVLGGSAPFFAQLVSVPNDFPFDVVSYDSTFLPRGLVSAGGLLRQEDIIQIGNKLSQRPPGRPILVLLHHHLIPAPFAEANRIDTRGRSILEKLLVDRVLPSLVSNGDHQEITNTALGAGSALTTLQTLGRAVLVLHGHVRHATARLLKGIDEGDADLLIASTGSFDFSGEDLSLSDDRRLSPSMNVVELSGEVVEVCSHSWNPFGGPSTVRRLAKVRREAARWHPTDERAPLATREPTLKVNESRVTLAVSNAALDRLDLLVTRRLESHSGAPAEQWDMVIGPPDARVVGVDARTFREQRCPARVRIGQLSSFRVHGGSYYGAPDSGDVAFGSVDLVNMNRCTLARLELTLGPVKTGPFGSVVDLSTGKERPYQLEHRGGVVIMEYPNCPDATLLRIYWPLAR